MQVAEVGCALVLRGDVRQGRALGKMAPVVALEAWCNAAIVVAWRAARLFAAAAGAHLILSNHCLDRPHVEALATAGAALCGRGCGICCRMLAFLDKHQVVVVELCYLNDQFVLLLDALLVRPQEWKLGRILELHVALQTSLLFFLSGGRAL